MLRRCGTLIALLVEPSTETSIRWCSPFGPGGIGESVKPVSVRSVPAPVGSVWQLTQAKGASSRFGGRKSARPRTASPFGSGVPAGVKRPPETCPVSSRSVGSVLSRLR